MALHVLEREQLLPIPIEEAWRFFSTPRELARITPPSMGFVIREPFDDRDTYAGQRIAYTVRPVLGIPLTWVTLIEVVEAPHRFVDTQLKGPYKRWWHEHMFTEVGGGTLMCDRVEYELPMGPLGELAHHLFVRRKLDHIFGYRRRVLEDLFPARAGRPLEHRGPNMAA